MNGGSSMPSLLPDIQSLSLAQQVAQMVVVRASGYLFDHQIRYPAWEPPQTTLKQWIQEWGVGGVILLGGGAAELALRTNQLQSWARVPLLMAADVEEGVGQRFDGATHFPPPMALAAIAQTQPQRAEQYAEQMGSVIAQESLAIGLNWVLAPVVDVNNNPQNPVINVRAFGETPAIVSQLTSAFIRGARPYPVLTVAKHFPGHGDTAIDSHLELPVIPHTLERLQQVELPPFQAAIAAGVNSVMSGHLLIPAWDPDYPATLSRRILTEGLRKDLAFEGLIVTDALVMGAIANQYGPNEAAVMAVEAGADILLMPVDPPGAIQAICAAVEAGRIAAERIQASVERIWQVKQRICAPTVSLGQPAHAWEEVAPTIEAEPLVAHLAQPAALALAADILQAAMRVYQPVSSRLSHPRWQNQARNLVLVDDALGCEVVGHFTPAIAQLRERGYHLQVIDRHTPACFLDEIEWQPTLLQLFVRGNPFRGSAGLMETAQKLLQQLIDSDQLQALIVYGSPYIADACLAGLPSDVPYVMTYGQMAQAQAIAIQVLFSTAVAEPGSSSA